MAEYSAGTIPDLQPLPGPGTEIPPGRRKRDGRFGGVTGEPEP